MSSRRSEATEGSRRFCLSRLSFIGYRLQNLSSKNTEITATAERIIAGTVLRYIQYPVANRILYTARHPNTIQRIPLGTSHFCSFKPESEISSVCCEITFFHPGPPALMSLWKPVSVSILSGGVSHVTTNHVIVVIATPLTSCVDGLISGSPVNGCIN